MAWDRIISELFNSGTVTTVGIATCGGRHHVFAHQAGDLMGNDLFHLMPMSAEMLALAAEREAIWARSIEGIKRGDLDWSMPYYSSNDHQRMEWLTPSALGSRSQRFDPGLRRLPEDRRGGRHRSKSDALSMA